MAGRSLRFRDRSLQVPLAVVTAVLFVAALLAVILGGPSTSHTAKGADRQHLVTGSPSDGGAGDQLPLAAATTTTASPSVSAPATNSASPGGVRRAPSASPSNPGSATRSAGSSPPAPVATTSTAHPPPANPYGGTQGSWSCDGRDCSGMTPHGTDSWTCTPANGRVNCSGAGIGTWSCGSTYQTWRTISCSAPTGDSFGGWQCNQDPASGPDADFYCYSNRSPVLQWKWKHISDPNNHSNDRWDGWGDTGYGTGTWSCAGERRCTGTVGATEIVSLEVVPLMISDLSP